MVNYRSLIPLTAIATGVITLTVMEEAQAQFRRYDPPMQRIGTPGFSQPIFVPDNRYGRGRYGGYGGYGYSHWQNHHRYDKYSPRGGTNVIILQDGRGCFDCWRGLQQNPGRRNYPQHRRVYY